MMQRSFGANSKGQQATLYTFRNQNGMVMEVTDFGATLYALRVPVGGSLRDVVLGYDGPAGYEGPSGTFFGATVGRNANRTGNGAFPLNGNLYQLDKNDGGKHNLHSGLDFQSFRVWEVREVTDNAITFGLHSPHMDQGFPGALDIQVTYTLTQDNAVAIRYLGVPQEDTVINYTNHSYFNLNGHDSGSILGHQLWLDADFFTPTTPESIPTGEIRSVEGSPMDFRVKKALGRDIDADYDATNYGQGYDHNWCLKTGGRLTRVAVITNETEDLTMEVSTDLPGVQIYTANFIDQEPGKDGALYQRRQGICFETQFYPDALNHENFPSSIVKAGERYDTTTVYRFV